MQNSKVRFKLYKAKKNWISAGLVTTAVLAGLTLGSVKNNDVVAHADRNVQTTATTNQQQEVTQDEYNKQQQKIADDQQNVNNAQKDVDDAQNAVDNAKSANENAAKVNDAKQAWKDAESNYDNANRDYNNAHQATAQAKSASDEAARYKDNFDKNEAGLYNHLQQRIAEETAAQAEAQTKVDNAQKAIESDQSDWNAVNDAQTKAQAKLNQLPNDAVHAQDRADLQKQITAFDKQKETLSNDADKQRGIQAAQNAIINKADKYIRNANKILAPYDRTKNPLGKDLLGHKAAAEKNAAYDAALQHEKDLKAIRDAARATADAKKAAYTQARADYNLPNDAEYARMQKEATGARQKINQDKRDTAYTDVENDEKDVKKQNDLLSEEQQKASKAQKDVDDANANLAKDQAALDEAKAAQKANTDPVKAGHFAGMVSNAQSQVDTDMIVLHGRADWKDGNPEGGLMAALNTAKEKVTSRQNKVKKANDKLENAKANPRYQKLLADIDYRQGIIDKADQAKANRAAAKDLDSALAPLAADLKAKQNVLKVYQDALAADQNILANMHVAGQPTNPDQPSNPNHGNTDNPSTPGHSNGSAVNGGNGAATNNGSAVNGGSSVANGAASQLTRAEYRAQQNAAAKSNTLPQTGNSESAAVVALGAVSAMLGFGLASKKREF